jgi:NADPH:quinone reductase-like Zn-dependent oxidoreductase
MKAARLIAHAPPTFRYEDMPDPVAGAGEVLIRVHAAAVTPTELQWAPTTSMRDGTPRPLPLVMGHELSGTVAGLGAGVVGVRVGDEVFGMNDWFRDGAQAEYCLARADEIAPKPRTIDHAHAAATPISALTAWQGLVDRARLARGERMLVHGASGAVGCFAVQLARRLGAYVIGTASAAKRDFVRTLGADEVLDYRTDRFDEALDAVDVVFDTVGGATLQRSWRVLAPNGRLVTIAASEEATEDPRAKAAFFIVEPRSDELRELARLIDAGELRTFVDALLPLAAASAAYGRKPERGKVVLTVVNAISKPGE